VFWGCHFAAGMHPGGLRNPVSPPCREKQPQGQAHYVETQQSKLSILQVYDFNRLTLPFGTRNAQSAQSRGVVRAKINSQLRFHAC